MTLLFNIKFSGTIAPVSRLTPVVIVTLVQRNAMPVWRGEGDFLTLLKADRDVAKAVSAAELEALFDLGYHLKHVDTIFGRVFGG